MNGGAFLQKKSLLKIDQKYTVPKLKHAQCDTFCVEIKWMEVNDVRRKKKEKEKRTW